MKRRGMSPPVVVKDSQMSLSVMFDVPPQGDANIGESDHRQLVNLKENIHRRLHSPVTLSMRPHRVGLLNCLSLHLSDSTGATLDLLITIAGNTVWPEDHEYARGVRWYINVADATDMMWLLKLLDVDRAPGA